MRAVRCFIPKCSGANAYSTKTKRKFRPSCLTPIHEDKEQAFKPAKKEAKSKLKLNMVEGEILYGIYPVLLALKSEKRSVMELYYNKNSERTQKVVELAQSKNITTTSISPRELSSLARNSTNESNVHQGICAYVKKVKIYY